MDKPSNCVLSFESYLVRDIKFNLNKSFFTGDYENKKLDIAIKHDVRINEEIKSAFVTLDCKIGGNQDTGAPFSLDILIEGQFIYLNESNDSPSFDRMCNINATAILYPYLRSVVTDITKAANINPVILPTVNINKILSNK